MNILSTLRMPQLALIASAFCLLTSAFGQGSLTPSGTPAPTMKSLNQIEARTPVDAAHTPGDGGDLFVISQPGSYYLTGNIIGVVFTGGILIATNDVTLDLNGFSVIGAPSGGMGIRASAVQNIGIRNGAVRNWSGPGIDCSKTTNCTIENIRAYNNADGIRLGASSSIAHCVVSANANGIVCAVACTVSECSAYNNNGSGFVLGAYNNISKCSSVSNLNTGIAAYFDGQNISGCIVVGNQYYGIITYDSAVISGCTTFSNKISGISVNDNSTISGCTSSGNNGDGIQFNRDCFITGNNACHNTGDGFYVYDQINRIDGNMASENGGHGIVWVNDLVIRNSCFLNAGGNYSPAVGVGNTGPINAASSSTNPWANF
jgi:parallel beta-helix repeat protein